MAFNLLVELSREMPDWKGLNQEMVSYSSKGIECFPIAQYGTRSENYLGVSFTGREIAQDRTDAFIDLILYLLKKDYKVYELYSGKQLSTENVHALINDFLG
jgi:hypothetical protein